MILKVKAKKSDIELLGNKFLAVQCIDVVDEVVVMSSQPGELINQAILICGN